MEKWYDSAVFYHIYPLGLLGAPKTHTEEEKVHRLRELEKWIPHIRDLNCTAVYLGPVFESVSHGYDTTDYRQVDSRLGDNEDLKRFVALCHEQGIRVVLDGVFNHTGREFFAFQDIREKREQSRYCSWYQDLNFWGNTCYNDGFYYKAWRNCFELANLNLWDEGVRGYLFDTVRFWIDAFDIDGIRLDCADCLEFGFMKELRRMTGEKKQDFWLMGEVIHGDYARWVNDEMLHSTTNYELHKGLYSGHNDHNYFEIAHTVRRQFDVNGGIYRGRTLYSFVENHDVDRLASKLNNPANLIPVYTLLYTLPGIPSIYYGGELGVQGRKEGPIDDYLRPRMGLSEAEKNPPHPELTPLLKELGGLKKEFPALSRGEYRELYLNNRQYAFARILGQEAVLVAVNNDEMEIEVNVPCPIGGETVREVFSGKEVPVENGRISWKLGANGSAIFRYQGQKV